MITHPNPSLRNIDMEIEELQAHTQGVLAVLNNFEKIAGSLASLVEAQYQVNKDIGTIGVDMSRAIASQKLGMAFDVLLKAVAIINISEQELMQLADLARFKNAVKESHHDEEQQESEQVLSPQPTSKSKKKLVN